MTRIVHQVNLQIAQFGKGHDPSGQRLGAHHTDIIVSQSQRERAEPGQMPRRQGVDQSHTGIIVHFTSDERQMQGSELVQMGHTTAEEHTEAAVLRERTTGWKLNLQRKVCHDVVRSPEDRVEGPGRLRTGEIPQLQADIPQSGACSVAKTLQDVDAFVVYGHQIQLFHPSSESFHETQQCGTVGAQTHAHPLVCEPLVEQAIEPSPSGGRGKREGTPQDVMWQTQKRSASRHRTHSHERHLTKAYDGKRLRCVFLVVMI